MGRAAQTTGWTRAVLPVVALLVALAFALDAGAGDPSPDDDVAVAPIAAGDPSDEAPRGATADASRRGLTGGRRPTSVPEAPTSGGPGHSAAPSAAPAVPAPAAHEVASAGGVTQIGEPLVIEDVTEIGEPLVIEDVTGIGEPLVIEDMTEIGEPLVIERAGTAEPRSMGSAAPTAVWGGTAAAALTPSPVPAAPSEEEGTAAGDLNLVDPRVHADLRVDVPEPLPDPEPAPPSR